IRQRYSFRRKLHHAKESFMIRQTKDAVTSLHTAPLEPNLTLAAIYLYQKKAANLQLWLPL
ncbi:MAG: hypothetical protein RR304_02950, partial [Bacteroides sp.]